MPQHRPAAAGRSPVHRPGPNAAVRVNKVVRTRRPTHTTPTHTKRAEERGRRVANARQDPSAHLPHIRQDSEPPSCLSTLTDAGRHQSPPSRAPSAARLPPASHLPSLYTTVIPRSEPRSHSAYRRPRPGPPAPSPSRPCHCMQQSAGAFLPAAGAARREQRGARRGPSDGGAREAHQAGRLVTGLSAAARLPLPAPA